MAAIQHSDARKAATNALMIHGFSNKVIKKFIFPCASSGNDPTKSTCHLMATCPYTVSRIVKKI